MKTTTTKDQRIATLLAGMAPDARARALIAVALRWKHKPKRRYVRR